MAVGLTRSAADGEPSVGLAVLGITVVVSVIWNMALGIVVEIGVGYLARCVVEGRRLDRWIGNK